MADKDTDTKALANENLAHFPVWAFRQIGFIPIIIPRKHPQIRVPLSRSNQANHMSGPLSLKLPDPFLSGVFRARSVRKHETSIALGCQQLLASSRKSSAVFSLYTACTGRAVCAPLSEQKFFSPCLLFRPTFRLVCLLHEEFARANTVRQKFAVEHTETSQEVSRTKTGAG